MTDLYFKRNNCRLCHSINVEAAVPLAPIPIATPNVHVPNADRNSPVYRQSVPLTLFLCKDCGLLQLMHVGNPNIQYNHYTYTTSLSLGLADHFREYAKSLLSQRALKKDSLVVEFGSNDGTLLRAFKERGFRVIGIEPASEIAERATEAGIETLNAFFSPDVASQVRDAHGPAALIIANNVIANIDDMDLVVHGLRDLMAPDGAFVFETQYGADVIDKKLLDTIYHEHLSYFNVKPLAGFFQAHAMQVIDVDHIETKGGSIRITVQHDGGPGQVSQAVGDAMRNEEDRGMYELGFYADFTSQVEDLRTRLNVLVDEHHNAGKPVGGYGVSVGTTTLLAQFGLTSKIDFLFDDDPNKDTHLSGPGYDIPIFGPDHVGEKKPGAIVIFSWRYAQPIMEKHETYMDDGGTFIIPLPDISMRHKAGL